jgi:tetratricopeptide (TPR) repeat protein
VSLGLAYARLGRRDEAVLTLGRAVERHPETLLAYTALGRVWLQSADRQNDPAALRKALEALKNAAEPAAATSEALTLYGRALYLSGNITQAERALQRAVTKMPVDPIAFRYLSETATRLGHTMTAREAARQYAALTSTPTL